MIWDIISPSTAIVNAIPPRHIPAALVFQYHTRSPQTTKQNDSNENPPPCCRLLFVSAPCLCPLLALPPAWPFLSSFCCASAGHVNGLTVPPLNTNLVSSILGLLPEGMIFFFRFVFPFLPVTVFFFVIYSAYISIDICGNYSRY